MLLDHGTPLVVVHQPPVGAHAEPEVAPLLGAVADAAVAVDVGELAAEGLAVEGGVEGFAAGHGFGVEGVVVDGSVEEEEEEDGEKVAGVGLGLGSF